MVFIHGGYFRSLSKLETSFIVEPYVARGITVALVNYPLCPDVAVGDIRDSVIRAFSFMSQKLLTPDEQRTIVVSGHSAGGAFGCSACDGGLAGTWPRRRPDQGHRFACPACLTLEPLIHTSINADIRLTTVTCAGFELAGGGAQDQYPHVARGRR